MEVTTEFLNKIEGRPEWLGEWGYIFASGELALYCRDKRPEFDVCVFVEGGKDVRVYVAPKIAAATALELATYARRVEIEVERRIKVGAP